MPSHTCYITMEMGGGIFEAKKPSPQALLGSTKHPPVPNWTQTTQQVDHRIHHFSAGLQSSVSLFVTPMAVIGIPGYGDGTIIQQLPDRLCLPFIEGVRILIL